MPFMKQPTKQGSSARRGSLELHYQVLLPVHWIFLGCLRVHGAGRSVRFRGVGYRRGGAHVDGAGARVHLAVALLAFGAGERQNDKHNPTVLLSLGVVTEVLFD